MPSFERGVYEPPNDDIRVFDEDERDMDEEGSRLPLLLVIALLVLAAFAGVVWLAYSQGVQRGRADAPRMIVAAPGPVKEAATDSPMVGHSLKIYEQPAPADDSDDESTPPPNDAVRPAPPPITAPPVAATPKPEPVKPKPAVIAHAVQQPVTPPVAARPPAVSSTSTTDVAGTATTAADRAYHTAAVSTTGAYMLQIGAYKSQAEADAAWKAYQFKHPAASAYSEDVHRADLGDKGVWYRLRIGSFSDKASADALCDKLKADGGACMLAK